MLVNFFLKLTYLSIIRIYARNITRNIILSCFFLFFIIVDLYFLIPSVIAQYFKPVSEFATPIGIPAKKAKAEIKDISSHSRNLNKLIFGIT